MTATILHFPAITGQRAEHAVADGIGQVRAQLPGMDASRISLAVARVERAIRRRTSVAVAVRRVVAWARYAVDSGTVTEIVP